LCNWNNVIIAPLLSRDQKKNFAMNMPETAFEGDIKDMKLQEINVIKNDAGRKTGKSCQHSWQGVKN
jgi:hypothetical protein